MGVGGSFEGQTEFSVGTEPLRDSLSPLCTAHGAQSNHWGDCPQALSLDLEDSAPGSPLRRTGPGRRQAEAHTKNDPRTTKARVPCRTDDFSVAYPSMSAGFSILYPG